MEMNYTSAIPVSRPPISNRQAKAPAYILYHKLKQSDIIMFLFVVLLQVICFSHVRRWRMMWRDDGRRVRRCGLLCAALLCC